MSRRNYRPGCDKCGETERASELFTDTTQSKSENACIHSFKVKSNAITFNASIRGWRAEPGRVTEAAFNAFIITCRSCAAFSCSLHSSLPSQYRPRKFLPALSLLLGWMTPANDQDTTVMHVAAQ